MQQILSDENCGCMRLMACCGEPYKPQMYDCLKHDLEAATKQVRENLLLKIHRGMRFSGGDADAELRLQELHLAIDTVLQAFAHWTRDNQRTGQVQDQGVYWELYGLGCIEEYLHRVFGLEGAAMLALGGFMRKEGCRWPVRYRPLDLTCKGEVDPPLPPEPGPGPGPDPCGVLGFATDAVRLLPEWDFTLTLAPGPAFVLGDVVITVSNVEGTTVQEYPAVEGATTFGPYGNLDTVVVMVTHGTKQECFRQVGFFEPYQVDEATAHDTGISHDLSHG